MLVAQDSNETTRPEQLDRPVKTFAPIECFVTSALSGSPHMLVDIAVPKFLINGCDPGVIHVTHEHRGEQFPIADVIQKERNRAAGPQLAVDRIQILSDNMGLHFLWRQ